jgi:hypothetical protein
VDVANLLGVHPKCIGRNRFVKDSRRAGTKQRKVVFATEKDDLSVFVRDVELLDIDGPHLNTVALPLREPLEARETRRHKE